MNIHRFTEPQDVKLREAWRFVVQSKERAERALDAHEAAPTAEKHASKLALDCADTTLCAAWDLYYDELRDARLRADGLAA